jgi:Flp pilus assembly protein TadD
MKCRLAVLAGVVAVNWSCARRVVSNGTPIQSSAVATVMQRQVRNAVDAGDGDYAIRQLRHRIASQPGDLGARLALAKRYEQAGHGDLALEHYRLASERFPDSAEAHIALARSLRKLNLRASAAEVLARFGERQASAPAELWSWLGILQDELGNSKLGEEAHRKAAATSPGTDWVHNNLGYNLLLQDRREEAAAEFQRALELNPRSEFAQNNLGIAVAAGRDRSVDEWQAGGSRATALNNLGAVLIEQGRYREARVELEAALRYQKDHPAALRNLQLVSELDGESVQVPAHDASGMWKRVGRGVVKAVFGGPEEPKQTAGGNGSF